MHVRQFMEYLADGNIDLVGVCVSNFLGNEFDELLTSFCPRLALMCFKEPKLTYSLYCIFPLANSSCDSFPRTVHVIYTSCLNKHQN